MRKTFLLLGLYIAVILLSVSGFSQEELNWDPVSRSLLSSLPGDYRVAIGDYFSTPKFNINFKSIKDEVAYLKSNGITLVLSPSDSYFCKSLQMYEKYGVQIVAYGYQKFQEGGETFLDKEFVKRVCQTYGERLSRHEKEVFKDKPVAYGYRMSGEPRGKILRIPFSAWKAHAKEFERETGIKFPKSIKKATPVQLIALRQWQSKKILEYFTEIAKVVKDYDSSPTIYFTPYLWLWDYSGFGKILKDVFFDPYPGRGLEKGSLYTGFASKFFKDVVGARKTWVIPQIHCTITGQHIPSPEEVRSWLSWAILNGADGISFYPADHIKGMPIGLLNRGELAGTNIGTSYARFTPIKYSPDNDPQARWKMAMFIARVFSKMNRIKFPSPDTAILFSSDSHMLDFNKGYKNLACAYTELGAKTGIWFEFISDRQIERGWKNLSRYKIIYVPWMPYEREKVIQKLRRFVQEGGVLVSSQPDILSYNTQGKRKTELKRKMFGIKGVGGTFLKARIILKQNIGKLRKGTALPLYEESYGIEVEDDVQVLASFEDGNPAIILKTYGKGKTIFSATPLFTDSWMTGLFKLDIWYDFYRGIQDIAGADYNNPIWKFRFPYPAGLIKNPE